MAGITQRIAEYALEARYEDIPDDVKMECKRILLDSLACALGGVATQKGRLAIGLARKLQGSPEATIIGVGDKLSLAGVAFANGEMMSALDFDVTLLPSHLSPWVLPASLAFGEKNHCSGKELILSIALSHEITTRIARALTSLFKVDREGNWSLPKSSGLGLCLIGGVIGTGKLLNFDLQRILYAMGVAGHYAPVAGGKKFANTIPGIMTKYSPAGWISMGEVIATYLAEMGYMGDTTVLDGDFGFWKMVGSEKWEPDQVMDGLGEKWTVLETTYKPYPCCRAMHAGMELLWEIMNENNFTAEDIEAINFMGHPLVSNPLWRNKAISNHIDAQFSVPYVFAVAAYGVKLTEWQDPRTMKDPRILEFMNKVSQGVHPDFGKIVLKEGKARIHAVEVTAKGQTFKREKTWAKGDVTPEEARMTNEDLVEKLRTFSSTLLSEEQIDELSKTVFGLEKVNDIAALSPLFSI